MMELDGMMKRAAGHESDNDAELEHLSQELARQQREMRLRGIPVLVLFEGWEAAGKGTLINRLAMTMDPRGYRVLTVQSATEQELLRPPLYRFWRDLPARGEIVLYDRSWYTHVWGGFAEGRLRKRDLTAACEDIIAFERTLCEHGYLLVKFFLQVSKKEQARRFSKLRRHRSTAWRIDAADRRQQDKYGTWRKSIERVIAATDASDGAFFAIDAEDRRHATLAAFRELHRVFEARLLADGSDASIHEHALAPRVEREQAAVPRISLSQVDLGQKLSVATYESQIQELRRQLWELGHLIFKKRVGVVVLCEGWDAAGKGGSIRRLVGALDPRGYEVIPISAPTPTEASMHYLWRFARRLPKAGHIAIFDRSWYGRVLVERVEGFCSELKWRLAYDEIVAFERHLVRSGNVLVKLWFHIDPDEQLRRFSAREQDPKKSWKITAEDWRNRDKWAEYERAVSDMLSWTDTQDCPWTIVPANDKLFARITAMQTVAGAIGSRLCQ